MRVLVSIALSLIVFCQTALGQTVYSYKTMENDLFRLAKTYPHLVHMKIIGHTPYHRNIYAVGVGTGKPCVVISDSHHAREWITSSIIVTMMGSYCLAYKNNHSIGGYPVRPILDASTIWFVPMVNPDGVTLRQLGPQAFPHDMYGTFVKWNKGSRDFTEWKANANGIDLNLQYDGDWDKIRHVSPVPASKDYKGLAPFQAIEVVSLTKFLRSTNPVFEVAYHCSGEVIFSNNAPDPRYPIAKDLSALTGYPVIGLKDSNGGLTDWWNRTMKKVGLTIEVGPFYGEKPVPTKYVKRIWEQNKAVGLYLASRASVYAQLKHLEPFQRKLAVFVE